MDIIPNVNPRPAAATKPATAATPAAKKPAGPIMEQRKIAAAQKSGMIVDARLYGVKPMDLAKFINTMIKPGPYSGYVYNQKMLNIANISLMYTKTISTDIKNVVSETSKLRTGIGEAFGKMIGMLQQGNVISEREQRQKIAKEQGVVANPKQEPAYVQGEQTNLLLLRILNEGKEEKEKTEKKGGGFISGLVGFFKNPLKFIWDMAGSVPFGKLILGGLVAGGIGYLLTKLFKNTSKALYDIFVPEGIKKFITGAQGFIEGTGKFFGEMLKEGPMEFLGKRLSESFNLAYDWFKDDFISPIVQTISNMAQDVGWYMGHIWDMMPTALGGRGLSAGEVTGEFELFKNARKTEQDYLRKQNSQDVRKTLKDIWFNYSDDEKKRMPLGIGPVGARYTPTTMTADQQKAYNEQQAIEQSNYSESGLYAQPQATAGGKIADIKNLKYEMFSATRELGRLYEEKYKEKLPISSARRTYEQQMQLYSESQKPGYTGMSVAYPTMSSPHIAGTAIDIGDEKARARILGDPEMMAKAGIYQPGWAAKSDPVHFELAKKAAAWSMFPNQGAAVSQPFTEPEKAVKQVDAAGKPISRTSNPTNELLARVIESVNINTEVTRSQKINSTTIQSLSPVYT